MNHQFYPFQSKEVELKFITLFRHPYFPNQLGSDAALVDWYRLIVKDLNAWMIEVAFQIYEIRGNL